MAKFKPFAKTIEVMVSHAMSPAERIKAVADVHTKAVAEADAQNRASFGRSLPSETWVDGRKGVPLTQINPDGGTILTRFEPVFDVVTFIGQLLHERSSKFRVSGDYDASHTLYADGAEVADWTHPPVAQVYVWMSSTPYARKIEGHSIADKKGKSAQGRAPQDGVYEGAVSLANKRFSNIARIRFTFEGAVGGMAQDYSAIALGGRKGGKTASAEKRAVHKKHNDNRFPAIRITLR